MGCWSPWARLGLHCPAGTLWWSQEKRDLASTENARVLQTTAGRPCVGFNVCSERSHHRFSPQLEAADVRAWCHQASQCSQGPAAPASSGPGVGEPCLGGASQGGHKEAGATALRSIGPSFTLLRGWVPEGALGVAPRCWGSLRMPGKAPEWGVGCCLRCSEPVGRAQGVPLLK